MYGVIIASGILLALLVGEKLAKGIKIDTITYWSSSLWAIIGGVVGARVYHIIDLWETYSLNPIAILDLRLGGLGIYGALIGGSIGLIAYFLVIKRDMFDYLDLAAVIVPLGQAVGRWGNFANMEIPGKPTGLPWGMYLPPTNRPPQYTFYDTFHPLFLYESLLDMFLFFALLLLYQRKIMFERKGKQPEKIYCLKGFFTLAYFTGYGIIRFGLEGLRIDPWTISGINVAQAISLGFILIGLFSLKIISTRLR